MKFASLPAALVALAALASMHSVFAGESMMDELAKSQYWLRLLHYKTSWLGHTRSLVDGPEFFFSPQGKTDPRAELEATVAAFSAKSDGIKVGRLKQHPQCAFPARYRFLKTQLQLAVADQPCAQLDEFLASFNAKSATLVFSSAYPNSPGSMFGHTFLRINSSTAGKNDLLDQGLSFAAAVPKSDGGLVFAVKGMLGGYIGQFARVPYYAKVNEYLNSESRDLWEYDLNLTSEETRLLLLNAWEIETNSWFDYFFFDENCAYVLLSLLEVAKPDWQLTDFAIYVIPGETVKAVTQIPGAVTGVKFRPSLRKKMYQRLGSLTGSQRELFFKVIRGHTPPASVGQPAVLESVASYLYYEKQKGDGLANERNAPLLQATLLRRSELGNEDNGGGFGFSSGSGNGNRTSTDDGNSNPNGNRNGNWASTRPDLGHDPYRLGTSSGVQNSTFFQDLNFKFAFHDLLNKDLGYLPFSQIDFPGATLRFLPGNGVWNIEQVQGLGITSLFPMTFLEKGLSWKFNLDYYSPKDLDCTTCHLGRAQAGLGATVELFTPDAIAYALAVLDFEAGGAVRKGFRWGPQLQAALLMIPHPDYKLQLAANLASDLLQPDRRKFHALLEWNQSLALSRNWEIRTALSLISPVNYREAKVTLNFYF
ncbi:MAG: DUF4105 domain-containing protein [Deltaproteobacteria bacterium]|nr:DUF4105 domain-containing protein [Deltaproteobacteria bacterium]